MPNITILIFGVLSTVFAILTVRDYFRGDGKLSVAARAWLRIAIIFALVTGLLLFLL